MSKVVVGDGIVTFYPKGLEGKSTGSYRVTGLTLDIEEAGSATPASGDAPRAVATGNTITITLPSRLDGPDITWPIGPRKIAAKGSRALRGAQWKREKKGRP